MLTIGHFGERASAVYLAGKICGVVHCYIGEEVKASASAAPSTVATESSWQYRGHGYCLTKTSTT